MKNALSGLRLTLFCMNVGWPRGFASLEATASHSGRSRLCWGRTEGRAAARLLPPLSGSRQGGRRMPARARTCTSITAGRLRVKDDGVAENWLLLLISSIPPRCVSSTETRTAVDWEMAEPGGQQEAPPSWVPHGPSPLRLVPTS